MLHMEKAPVTDQSFHIGYPEGEPSDAPVRIDGFR
jgi:hypothetical protein